MMLLLDTSIVIDYLRHSDRAVVFVRGLLAKPSLSVVTIAELLAGARSRREEDRINDLLNGSHLLPVTREIAASAGALMRHYQSSHGLDDFDAVIAATAALHELPLATLNVKHFPMMPKLRAAY